MEKHKPLKTCATIAAFLLIGTFGAAQTAATAHTLKPSERRASNSRQRKDGAIAHADYSRPADQRKSGNSSGMDGGSNAAAHAAARSNAPSDAAKRASNKAGTGENPLYESKDGLKANAGTSNSQPDPKTAADASRKHLAGVKYQNRTSAGQGSEKSSSKEKFKQDFGPVQAARR